MARDIIEQYQPDVIGFQEFQQDNGRLLQPSLTDYTAAWGLKSADESEFGPVFNAIYWRTARFDCVAKGSFYLSKTPEIYSGDWGIIHN